MPAKGLMLDGFPRTPGQHALFAAGLVPHHIVVLNASTETVLCTRVRSRAAAAKAKGEPPRADDNEATVRRRLIEYERNRAATLQALRAYLRLASVDGGAKEVEVSEAVRHAIDSQRRRT